MDSTGTVYAIWVDADYVLRMARSTDYAGTWSDAVVIGAPGGNTSSSNVMAYLPTMVHHPTQVGRAALAYYGSADGGATYHAYLAETTDLQSANPTWTSIIANPPSAPMQANQDGSWDQGYGDPLWDLVEFSDIKYRPGSDDLVAAFARKMCSGGSCPPPFYNTSTCLDGWDYTAHNQSMFQGFVAFGSH